MDPDSVIFKAKEGEPIPSLGDYLGEITDILPPGHYIEEFISSGSKSYAYRQDDDKQTKKENSRTYN